MEKRKITSAESYKKAYLNIRKLRRRLGKVGVSLSNYLFGKPSLVDNAWLTTALSREKEELKNKIQALVEARAEWRKEIGRK